MVGTFTTLGLILRALKASGVKASELRAAVGPSLDHDILVRYACSPPALRGEMDLVLR